MGDFPIFQVGSCLGDLQPAKIIFRGGSFCDSILHSILDALGGGSNEFDFFIGVNAHVLNISWLTSLVHQEGVSDFDSTPATDSSQVVSNLDHVDGHISHYLLESGVLLFKLFRPLERISLHPSVFALPLQLGRQTDRLASDGFLHLFSYRKVFSHGSQFLDDFLFVMALTFNVRLTAPPRRKL
jgi:hypothetical protein